ncbi:odorant receptor 94b-like [Calliphora vicina]|uniref:odorant receptor 94b-like n=1 Tax=Calliphora vicina TaxID=7373 RepID=UPI00325A6D46
MTKISPKECQTMHHCDKISGARVILTILRCVALWPWQCEYENETKMLIIAKMQHVQRFIIHVPATLLFCLLMWVEAFTSSDLDQAGNVLYMSLALSVYIVKLVNMGVLSKKASSFIYELEHNTMYDFLSPKEAEMWSKHQKSFRNVVIIFTCGSVFSGVFAFVGVLFDSEYRLGFPYWLPFEWRNPERYWYAYAFNVTGILVSCLSNVSLDMLGCYMIFHIGLLYKLLGMRYSGIRSVKEVPAIKEFRKLFLMHASIKRMTKECESLISHYVLAQIIFSALIICFCGYRLQKMNILAELSQFFAMLQFLSVMILEIYLPCHFANQITMNSANLLNNIYDCEWLKFSTANRKFLRLYMEFFKHPERLRAGKFFEVGLPIFTKVMNNAYSYFALLLNMDK